jgi:hypothetical protein
VTKEQIFEIWAPIDGIWTPWAKPVVFAQEWPMEETSPQTTFEADWLHPSSGQAIVLDLPGPSGVEIGIALAKHGYRPVPLYNAMAAGGLVKEAVNVRALRAALGNRTAELAGLNLPTDAPPVFLLDADRRTAPAPDAGCFDNRSICFPTDFPSATFLARHGISSVLLMTQTDPIPQADLSHALLRWQTAGIEIRAKAMESDSGPEKITVAKPSWFRSLVYGWIAARGLIRSPFGGYGGIVPFDADFGGGG